MYKRERRSSVYLINLYNEHESFQKVGSCKGMFARFRQMMRYGYSCRVLCQVRGLDSWEAFEIEKAIQDALRDYRYSPKILFAGYTECFTGIDPIKFKHLVTSNVDSYIDVIENEEVNINSY